MKASARACVVGLMLAVAVGPCPAAALETGILEPDASSSAAIDGRADEVTAWSVDGGGGESAGGGFAIIATIGQPEAGLVSQCGNVLAGGLWAGVVDFQPLFCNGFEGGGTDVWSSAVGGTP